MTDAELLELYVLFYEAFVSDIVVIMSLISGYLVVSYLVAKELSRFRFAAVSVLFVSFTISVSLGARDTCARTVSLQEEIIRRIQEDDSAIAFVSTAGVPVFLPAASLAMVWAALALAVVFSVSQRRRRDGDGP